MTSIINTIRDLLARQPVSNSIWTALAWCLGILIVAYALAMAAYHRKIAKDVPPSANQSSMPLRDERIRKKAVLFRRDLNR